MSTLFHSPFCNMKAFIIEDEVMAQAALAASLLELFPDITIAGTAKSVKDAVAWLSNPANEPDIIFMDVELSDGKCFEIFRKTEVKAPVIMTTAYDTYAVKAFEVNSLDYLLKPIEPAALQRAVERCKSRAMGAQSADLERLMAALQTPKPEFKETILVQFGDHLIPLQCADISFIYSEDKANHIVTTSGAQYMIDETLDSIIAKLDPAQFFKISRSCIVARKSIGSITKLLGSRLRIELSPKNSYSPEVSRAGTDAFLAWLAK